MSRDLTVIYRGWHLQDVYLLRNLLVEQGIPAVVLNENIQSLWGAVPMTPETAPQIAVPDEFAESARGLAQQFDAVQRQAPQIEETPPPLPGAKESLAAWPVCPDCGAARPAKCPVCGEIAETFRLADEAPRSAGLPPELLDAQSSEPKAPTHVCGLCSEPMTPLFARRCPHCGHDFGAGADIGSKPSADEEPRPFNYRVLLVFLAVVVSIAAMTIYIAHITPKGKAKNIPAGVPATNDEPAAPQGISVDKAVPPVEVAALFDMAVDVQTV